MIPLQIVVVYWLHFYPPSLWMTSNTLKTMKHFHLNPTDYILHRECLTQISSDYQFCIKSLWTCDYYMCNGCTSWSFFCMKWTHNCKSHHFLSTFSTLHALNRYYLITNQNLMPWWQLSANLFKISSPLYAWNIILTVKFVTQLLDW